jgi:hypothetical protein
MPVVTDWPEMLNLERLNQWSARRCSSLSRDRFARALANMLEVARADDLIQPRVAYQFLDLAETDEDGLRLPNGSVIEWSPTVAEVMAKPQSLAVAVATIGSRLEAEVAALFSRKQAVKAMALEEIGVAALFELSTGLGNLVAEEAQAFGLKTSSPLFPGDDGIDLGHQKTVFELAGGGDIGMHLSGGAMLFPVKSASMIFGLGKHMPRWDQNKKCAVCKARNKCLYRWRGEAAAA